jgi:hypothetical protein
MALFSWAVRDGRGKELCPEEEPKKKEGGRGDVCYSATGNEDDEDRGLEERESYNFLFI